MHWMCHLTFIDFYLALCDEEEQCVDQVLQIHTLRCWYFSAGVIEGIAVSAEGALFCSVGDDQAMKVFDVVNFDMINMLKLG